LGFWFDEHLDLQLAINELAKSANRALGLLTSTFYFAGCMTYDVFTKLYESTIQLILLYCAAIWGQSDRRPINAEQNRAMKLFAGVTKNTSNVGVQGDIG